MTGQRVRQAGQVRPRPNKLTSRKLSSTNLARELPSRGTAVGATGSDQSAGGAPRVANFEQELEATREALQTAVRDQDIAAETIEQQRVTSNELRAILDSTDVATLVLDADLHILFFTPAAKSLFDVTASDIGRPLVDLPRCLDDGDLLVDARAVLASCAAIRREVRADDGRWFIRGMLPYRTDDRDVTGLVVTFTGISEIKAAERGIEAARAYLDSIIATIRQPLVVLDETLHVISASSSFHRVFSVKPEKLIGRHLLAAGEHLDVPALREFLASIQARGTTINDHEVEIELPGAGRRAFSMSARVLRELPSAKRKILVAIVDITEAKREGKALEAAKSEAERANIGKSRFLAAASHDLRQPLQTIRLIQGLLEKRTHDDITLKLVRRLDETVGTMSSMLDKLLDINELEAGTVRPEIVDFPISHLLAEMRSELTYHTATSGLDWSVVSSGLAVRSDPRLLEQIVRNLLSNAVKYTNKGKLLLGCRRRGDNLRIEIWDTGPGIPAPELRAIFEEFHQLDNPARERSKGLGLGLAIVQRLANLLGHKIDVRSRLGMGSVFTVEVPLGRVGVERSPVRDQSKAQQSALSHGTILIVEDDPAVLEMLQILFDDYGHRTLIAADGHAALALTAKAASKPDLVIADYNLPNGLNGLELISALQTQLQRAVPGIILTGDISTDSLRRIAAHGCVHLNKPVRAPELMRLAQRLLAESRVAAREQALSPPLRAEALRRQTVFVIDDDSALREVMRDLLQEHGYAVEMFADGPAFFEAYRPGWAGCVLVDALMPGMSGIELIERLKHEGHELPAIVITGNGAVPMAVQAMKAGAVDFIEKPVGHTELLASVERALDRTKDTAKSSASRETALLQVATLTTRQRQILDLVLAGHPSKNIAADLGISQRTVDNHRAAIMRKTGSKSLPALVRTALAAA
jgi:two-component system CheB/CheR fusion protein